MKMTVKEIPAMIIYEYGDVIRKMSKRIAKKHAACVKMVSKEETSSNSIICHIILSAIMFYGQKYKKIYILFPSCKVGNFEQQPNHKLN